MNKENIGAFADPIWAIVELMGRQVIAGQIQGVSAVGTELLRVDVPAVDGTEAFTKFYGGSALYAITPTNEETAMYAVKSMHVRPINEWVIPSRHAIENENRKPEQSDNFVEEDDIPF